jgi:hypothetical protein
MSLAVLPAAAHAGITRVDGNSRAHPDNTQAAIGDGNHDANLKAKATLT